MSRRAAKLDRTAAMAAKPCRRPFLRREFVGEGTKRRLRVTVAIQRTGWTRWFGAPHTVERTFALDAMGQAVYDACDGTRRVSQIARDLAREHRISLAEAETAVAVFLKTLMTKGLVTMSVRTKERGGT